MPSPQRQRKTIARFLVQTGFLLLRLISPLLSECAAFDSVNLPALRLCSTAPPARHRCCVARLCSSPGESEAARPCVTGTSLPPTTAGMDPTLVPLPNGAILANFTRPAQVNPDLLLRSLRNRDGVAPSACRPRRTPSPWSLVLRRRFSSPVSTEGVWIADNPDEPLVVVQLIVEESLLGGDENNDRGGGGNLGGRRKAKTVKSRMSMYSFFNHRPEGGNYDKEVGDTADLKLEEATKSVVSEAIRVLLANTFPCSAAGSDCGDDVSFRVSVMFSGLDRRLLKPVQTALALPAFYDPTATEPLVRSFKSTWRTECKLYTYRGSQKSGSPIARKPPPGCTIRALKREDAELVNSRWEYRSDDSIQLVRRMIDISVSDDDNNPGKGGCLGMEVDGELVAWVLQYLDGAVGMIWTEEGYRQRGFASTLVSTIMAGCERRIPKENFLFAFVVDGNAASCSMFERLDWNREASADWVGFASFDERQNRKKEKMSR